MVSTHFKNFSQIGSSPQVGVKIKNVWNHHLEHDYGKKGEMSENALQVQLSKLSEGGFFQTNKNLGVHGSE